VLIIVAGSEGVVGSAIVPYLEKNNEVVRLSGRLGHDFGDEDFVRGWFRENSADYLVNCFGVDDKKGVGTFFDILLGSVDRYLSVNVTALFSVCREFARNDLSKGIVNISSIYGLVSPVPSLYEGEKHIGYSVAKAGVVQLTRHLAVHLAPRIRVNCVVLGGVENGQDSEFQRKYNERVPMGRMMRGDEIPGIVEYLCSEKSSYMTGSIINLDGGWCSI
jgi:NAD(P)-dependent dehydrogenase (short-subunit alcohol dehydrogenase family)